MSICKMSGENREDIEFLELALEEGNLWEILEAAQKCGALEPGLEKRVKKVARQHKEELIDYLSDLCSTERRRCGAVLVFRKGLLEVIYNFEKVYGLEQEVKISKRKGILLRRVKRDNFKKPPEGLEYLGLVPRGLTAEEDGPYDEKYMLKVQRELVPEIENIGLLGKEQIKYVTERTDELSKHLDMLHY